MARASGLTHPERKDLPTGSSGIGAGSTMTSRTSETSARTLSWTLWATSWAWAGGMPAGRRTIMRTSSSRPRQPRSLAHARAVRDAPTLEAGEATQTPKPGPGRRGRLHTPMRRRATEARAAGPSLRLIARKSMTTEATEYRLHSSSAPRPADRRARARRRRGRPASSSCRGRGRGGGRRAPRCRWRRPRRPLPSSWVEGLLDSKSSLHLTVERAKVS
jgi:hypothetical protein